MNRRLDLKVRPGHEWELGHFLLSVESFDPFYGELGIDINLASEVRPKLRALIAHHDWPVEGFPTNERGWNCTEEIFGSPDISDRFKSWYYTWFRTVAYSRWGKRERLLFDSFLVPCPKEFADSLWWKDKVQPVRRESRRIGKKIEGLKGRLDDWIPAALQRTCGSDYLDLCDFAESSLCQWRLRVVMQEVLASMDEEEIAAIDRRFREFCVMASVVPRPLSCVFDRGLHNGDFRLEYR